MAGRPNTLGSWLRRQPRWLLPAAALLAGAGAAFAAYAWYEARVTRVEHHDVHSPRVPRSLSGFRLIFLADVHAGPLFGLAQMAKLVDRINELAPDLVVLGGDYVGGQTGGARIFYSQVGRIEATFGAMAVLGNHDVWEGADEARRGMAAAGVRLLENELERIAAPDGSIVVAGVQDLWTGAPDPDELASRIAATEFGILVTHNPDVLAWALPDAPDAWDLALAGHTHGGQIVGMHRLVPRKPTRHGRRYLAGWSEEHGAAILVTHGVGTVTLPVRFQTPPQLHVIDLYHETPGMRRRRRA